MSSPKLGHCASPGSSGGLGSLRTSGNGWWPLPATFLLLAQVISEEREGCHENGMTMCCEERVRRAGETLPVYSVSNLSQCMSGSVTPATTILSVIHSQVLELLSVQPHSPLWAFEPGTWGEVGYCTPFSLVSQTQSYFLALEMLCPLHPHFTLHLHHNQNIFSGFLYTVLSMITFRIVFVFSVKRSTPFIHWFHKYLFNSMRDWLQGTLWISKSVDAQFYCIKQYDTAESLPTVLHMLNHL